MAQTEWMIRGPEISTCNCDYSCPCQFNALPTHGHCNAAIAMRIEEGHHGKTRLDGLLWAMVAAWPGAIHQGHGQMLRIVDKRASPEQREAMLRILSGEDTEPGATFFWVFTAMSETFHPPVYEDIHFEADFDSCEGHFSVPGVVQAKTHAIRNPVTHKPHYAKVSLRAGFEYKDAEFAAGTAKTHGMIALDNHDSHAHLCIVHLSNKGIVH